MHRHPAIGMHRPMDDIASDYATSPIILTERARRPRATPHNSSAQKRLVGMRPLAMPQFIFHLLLLISSLALLLMGRVPFLMFLPFCPSRYPPPPLVVEIFRCASCSSPFCLEASSTLRAWSTICSSPYCLIYFICFFPFFPILVYYICYVHCMYSPPVSDIDLNSRLPLRAPFEPLQLLPDPHDPCAAVGDTARNTPPSLRPLS